MYTSKSLAVALVLLSIARVSVTAAEPARLKLLFLGDDGHHQPAIRFKQLQPELRKRKIDLVYTDAVSDLNSQTLAEYDGLVVYANIDEISDDQARALLAFVEGGKGFIPLHCASYCFRNHQEIVGLIGGQFLRHETGMFRTTIVEPDHPVMKGFSGFESWDETYVHTRHNPVNRVVLETRTEGDAQEPWTWVRTHGKGRVFYTAWGHDGRTFSNPGFVDLVERGIRWACGGDPSIVPPFADRPQMTSLPDDLAPFEYVEADVPFYPPGKRWGTVENGPRKMQLPVSPEESMKHFVTPVGFQIKLFASEKDFQGKPISMNWDERGRLWICETTDYPNELQPVGQGRDRIRILEDTDGDWVADKFTVFAEHLSIPTAITFYRGGAIVQDGTETVYLKDTDGDDRADYRKVLITGWGMGDTHGEVSNFQFGLDNWYYAMQGYNDSSPVLTDGRKVTSFRQGFFRFKVSESQKGSDPAAAPIGSEPQPDPVVTELEFLRSTNNNTWGLGLSEEGLVFGSTANGNPSEFMPIPNRYYEGVRGWSSTVLEGIADSNKFEPLDADKVRQVDHHGGFTAAAGHALYTARNYPKEYWNRTAFVTEATGHLVATFVLRDEGAGFRSKNSWNLLASNDEWSGPIMAEVGPDGNVWVIDWYNFIIQHNPTPIGFQTGKGNAYESSLRDKKHGRIYRVVYTGNEATQSKSSASSQENEGMMQAKAVDLSRAHANELVAALHSPNFLWRRHAQRLLIEKRHTEAIPELVAMIKEQSIDEIGLATEINHALWTLHALGGLTGENREAHSAVVHALNHPSAGVRRNALLVLPRDSATIATLQRSGVLRDRNAKVRLAGFLTLAELPASAEATEEVRLAMVAPENSDDRWLREALIAAAARHDLMFLKSVIQSIGEKSPGPHIDVIRIVAEHYARGGNEKSVASLFPLLVQSSEGTVASDRATGIISAMIEGLAKGWPRGQQADFDESTEGALVELLNKLPVADRGPLATFATRAGSKKLETYSAEIAASFLTIAKDEKQPDDVRRDAAVQLLSFRRLDGEAAKEVIALVTPRTPPELAQAFIEAVNASEAPEAGGLLIESQATLTPSVRPTVIRLLLGRVDWTDALLDALEQGKISMSDLSLDQKQGMSAHPNKELADRAKKVLSRTGGLPNPDRQKVLDELLPLADQTGDVAAGRDVFKKQCSKCHTHSGEGTRIGPDLTGMAVHPKKELLTHIIDPSRSVEGNYRVYSVVLNDGRVMNGLLASESKTAIEIFDAEGKKHALQRADIEELIASTKSLMPEGFEKQVKPDEIKNLLEFLTQRGKYLPIPIDKVATVVSTKEMFHDGQHDEQKLIFPDWAPRIFEGVPFVLVDPQGDRVANAIMLYGTNGDKPPRMPKRVALTCNSAATAIHLLGGVSGWGWPASEKGLSSLIVRLKYRDGAVEEHVLKNGEHFADYIRRVDVPQSQFAFPLRNQQIRYLKVVPGRTDPIETIELVKGNNVESSPIVMAITVETPAASEKK
ncbi:PVC-type heme-binding CxxCH protein [Schlesneria sp. T3-172]|uniref:PVC-type heme-binding CxxCH protein n=1 Tax=Schlesneria sphaerica TaxID=3373610 RepID=UPI0037CB05A4